MAVVPLPTTNEIALPSRFNTSLSVSSTFETVTVNAVIAWPDSIVETPALVKRLAAEPFSVNVGLLAVAVRVGSSFTEVTLSVLVAGVPESAPSFGVTVNVISVSELVAVVTSILLGVSR